MPRPGPRRPNIGIRMGDDLVARLDQVADKHGISRSDVVRMMLEYALDHMPKDWRPPRY